jgi:uncharacterized glyoxalase superfamily metalloenzyme YdcJ
MSQSRFLKVTVDFMKAASASGVPWLGIGGGGALTTTVATRAAQSFAGGFHTSAVQCDAPKWSAAAVAGEYQGGASAIKAADVVLESKEAAEEIAVSTTRRARFAQAMADMYGKEVPQYPELVELVADVNAAHLKKHPELAAEVGDLGRLVQERHGAIRLGRPDELATMARLFKVMGMEPVDYYDLTASGLPVHSTAFRPTDPEALETNPFRVFTSLLRTDLLPDELQAEIEPVLAKRQIFSDILLELIELHEAKGDFTALEEAEFVREATAVFRWQPEAAIDQELYERLLKQNSLVADIVGFQNPHINHLTPRTLDIDAVHAEMEARGMKTIPQIQGAPRRKTDVVLRQTSFQALDEPTKFPDGAGGYTEGTHRARFGEIEQRGVALTPEGRALYDRLLAEYEERSAGMKPAEKDLVKQEVFAEFPEGWDNLRKAGLAYFDYQLSPDAATLMEANGDTGAALSKLDMNILVERGYVVAVPITYEDFLPASAAGIFGSNLDDRSSGSVKADANLEMFEAALGRPVLRSFDLYGQQQEMSIEAVRIGIAMESAGKWASVAALDNIESERGVF